MKVHVCQGRVCISLSENPHHQHILYLIKRQIKHNALFKSIAGYQYWCTSDFWFSIVLASVFSSTFIFILQVYWRIIFPVCCLQCHRLCQRDHWWCTTGSNAPDCQSRTRTHESVIIHLYLLRKQLKVEDWNWWLEQDYKNTWRNLLTRSGSDVTACGRRSS